jgi:hypothetical protein
MILELETSFREWFCSRMPVSEIGFGVGNQFGVGNRFWKGKTTVFRNGNSLSNTFQSFVDLNKKIIHLTDIFYKFK